MKKNIKEAITLKETGFNPKGVQKAVVNGERRKDKDLTG